MPNATSLYVQHRRRIAPASIGRAASVSSWRTRYPQLGTAALWSKSGGSGIVGLVSDEGAQTAAELTGVLERAASTFEADERVRALFLSGSRATGSEDRFSDLDLLVVIEDVISTGGQVIESCRALRQPGAEILAVLAVVDRESGGAANIAAEGLELRSAFTWGQLRAAAAH